VARFPGSADFAPAQSKPTTFTIAPATTTIVLQPHAVLTRKKVLKGVELTATIEPVALGRGVPTGTVTFEFVKKLGKKVKVTTLGTAALSGGAATLTFNPTKVLNQPLLIVYSGDPDFLASTISPRKLTRSEVTNSRI
jgi:large repetitive protein